MVRARRKNCLHADDSRARNRVLGHWAAGPAVRFAGLVRGEIFDLTHAGEREDVRQVRGVTANGSAGLRPGVIWLWFRVDTGSPVNSGAT
jgi:hypothetical protein